MQGRIGTKMIRSQTNLLGLSTVNRYQRCSACHRSHICEQIFIDPQQNREKNRPRTKTKKYIPPSKRCPLLVPRQQYDQAVAAVLHQSVHAAEIDVDGNYR